MFADYHVHTRFSYDAMEEPEAMLRQAKAVGLDQLCFTEHMDYDETPRAFAPVNVPAYAKYMRALKEKSPIPFCCGLEVALKDQSCADEADRAIGTHEFDFIIGSVHNTDLGDPYERSFFNGKTKEQAYRNYIENIERRIRFDKRFHVLGHYDYVAKNAPYPDKAMTYSIAPDEFDEVFRFLIQTGRAMEYNTSAQKDMSKPLWGEDILRRYVELGGEFLTFGSDSHYQQYIGWRIKEAMELAKRAGVKYMAVFSQGKPTFHAL